MRGDLFERGALVADWSVFAELFVAVRRPIIVCAIVSRRRLIVVLSTGHLMALYLIELKLIELSFGVFVFGERNCAPEFFDRVGLILTKKDDPAEALALVVQCQI